MWHRRKTGKFTVGNKATPPQFEVDNDLYGFSKQHNLDNNTTYNNSQNCYEEYDSSNGQKKHVQSYRNPSVQDSTIDKRNIPLTDNPLYKKSDVYDSTIDYPSYKKSNSNDPPMTNEIYMNVSSDAYNARMGTDKEYDYCRP